MITYNKNKLELFSIYKPYETLIVDKDTVAKFQEWVTMIAVILDLHKKDYPGEMQKRQYVIDMVDREARRLNCTYNQNLLR